MKNVKVKPIEWKEGLFPLYFKAITPFCNYRIFCNLQNKVQVDVFYFPEFEVQSFVSDNIDDAKVLCQMNHSKWVQDFIEE